MGWRERVLAGLSVVALAGCQATASAPETVLAPAPLVRQDGVSLKNATVALVTLEGAPEVAGEDFSAALFKQFGALEIPQAEARKAKYLLRVYLSATPAEGGADLGYVADVFDARHVRIGRLDYAVSLKGSGDAWSLASGPDLETVAARCAQDLAALLSNQSDTRAAAMSYAN